MGLALKWLTWPVLMHCFGLPLQGPKKGMLPKYGGGWEESKDFLFNDTSGKYISAQHWQSTMYCSGQSCQKHLNCNETAAFVIELKQFDACKTSGPYSFRKNRFPKEFHQSQLSVPSLKTCLSRGPSKNIYRVEKTRLVFWKDFHPQEDPLEALVFSGGPRSW